MNLLKSILLAVVKDVTESLCEIFHGLTINEFTVYRHITEKLEFTLTGTQARFVNRNSDDTLEQRRQFIEHIDAMNDETFYKRRCIFVDESGFKKNMVRPVPWVDVEAEGPNLRILGCMSAYGLSAVSQQVLKSSWKKYKTATGIKRGLPHGTNSLHFTLFVEEIVSVLNKLGLKKMYIVMDNAAIHKTPEVLKAIRDSGHNALFLPPH